MSDNCWSGRRLIDFANLDMRSKRRVDLEDKGGIGGNIGWEDGQKRDCGGERV